MSATATRTLVEMGYTDVVDLAGGMNAWVETGRPLEESIEN
jgi:rhodanese-related sulfurtransferase